MCAALAFELTNKVWLFWLVFLGFLGGGMIGMRVCRKRPILVVVILALIALAGAAQMVELDNLYAHDAISAKASLRYVVLSYLAICSSMAFVVVGTVQGWRQRKLEVGSR